MAKAWRSIPPERPEDQMLPRTVILTKVRIHGFRTGARRFWILTFVRMTWSVLRRIKMF